MEFGTKKLDSGHDQCEARSGERPSLSQSAADPTEFSMRRGGAPPNMKMDCRSSVALVTIALDGRSPVSLGTAVIDPLTMNPFSSANAESGFVCSRGRFIFRADTEDAEVAQR